MTESPNFQNRYRIIAWRVHVRADGEVDGYWSYFDLDEDHPDDAEPIFQDTWGGEVIPDDLKLDFLPEGNDAWKQHYELLERFTKEWSVRTDLSVTAHACDRSVELGLAYPKHDTLELVKWHTTQRNVNTMRELASVILAACNFVEESNPVWASHGLTLRQPEAFEVDDV